MLQHAYVDMDTHSTANCTHKQMQTQSKHTYRIMETWAKLNILYAGRNTLFVHDYIQEDTSRADVSQHT